MLSKRDKVIPYYFIAFFVVLFIADAIMVTIAVKTHTGTVTEKPYEKGLAYNHVLEAREKQSALGWRGDITYQNGVLQFDLKDADGKLLKIDNITATLFRPTQAGMDFAVELTKGNAAISFPAKGLWEVRISATVGEREYQQSKRIVVE